jgi:hypothetical protein
LARLQAAIGRAKKQAVKVERGQELDRLESTCLDLQMQALPPPSAREGLARQVLAIEAQVTRIAAER